MPIRSVLLRPGINTELTATLNEAGYSTSNLIRWMAGLAQSVGGWVKYYAFNIGGIARAMHAWMDFNQNQYLAVAAGEGNATQLGDLLLESGVNFLLENGGFILLEGSGAGGINTDTILGVINNGVLTDITPQALITNSVPNFATTASSATVTVTDPNVANPTTYDSIYLNTPVSVGGIILSGLYPITLVLGTTNYQITVASAATLTRQNATITAATNANPCVITAVNDFGNGDLIYITGVSGMTQLNGNLYAVSSVSGTQFTLTGINSTGYGAYISGGTASPSHVPQFTTTSGSATVSVKFGGHGLSVGSTINFPIPTTVGGVTITGTNSVTAVADANTFSIVGNVLASSSTTAAMNLGSVELVYAICIGPVAATTGYSIGTYSSGGYSTGVAITPQTGPEIVATDWSLANWGQTLLANPRGGGIYQWTPGTGLQNAQLISSTNAPAAVNFIFVAMPAQILVALGVSAPQSIGSSQNPLRVQWSDQLNFNNWVVSTTTQAGSFTIPTGSTIVSGLQGPQSALIWTDLDLWAMQYIGYPLVFGFNKISSSCGLIAPHARVLMGNGVYWMGLSNFFMLSANGATVIPCTVWDAVFQNLDPVNQGKCWAWGNTTFNEVWFFYPSLSNTNGECDSYVKYNTVENVWDYGALPRSAGIDQSILGTPIAASPQGFVYQHEQGEDADGSPMPWSWRTGFWSVDDGSEVAFVDWLFPDFQFGFFNAAQKAQIPLTLYSRMYANGPETSYGPFTLTSSVPFINPRVRGREIAIAAAGGGVVSNFARLGRLRFRAAPDGKLG